MKESKKNVKAQAAVMGLIFAFMLIAAAAVMTNPLIQFIEIGINETENSSLEHKDLIVVVMQMIPLFMWLIILVAVVALITGRQS